ncbi:stromal membrane-associated GTPase-activating protein 2 [Pelomyxa schiedti]|nr:stromal membrane-associated GTPase-activating protein 2 [Pelomyxa schiedti]
MKTRGYQRKHRCLRIVVMCAAGLPSPPVSWTTALSTGSHGPAQPSSSAATSSSTESACTPSAPVGCFVVLRHRLADRFTGITRNIKIPAWDEELLFEGVKETDEIILECWYTMSTENPPSATPTPQNPTPLATLISPITPNPPSNTTASSASVVETPPATPSTPQTVGTPTSPQDLLIGMTSISMKEVLHLTAPLSTWVDIHPRIESEPNVACAVQVTLLPFDSVLMKEGWLHKQGKKGNISWQKRWFDMHNSTLSYYESAQKKELLGAVTLDTDSFLEHGPAICKKVGHANTFAIHTPVRSYILRAADKEEGDTWVATLSEHLASYIPGTTHTRLFGVSLDTLVKRPAEVASHSKIPLQIKTMIKRLLVVGTKEEGIFRVPGLKAEIDNCVKLLDKGKPLPDNTNPHSLAGLLKLFLRSLPEPLLPTTMTAEFTTALNIQESTARNLAIGKVLCQLPSSHRHLLSELTSLCASIAASAITQMTSRNLAIVLGPNLTRDSTSTPTTVGDAAFGLLRDVKTTTLLLETLISSHDEIFAAPQNRFQLSRSQSMFQITNTPHPHLPPKSRTERRAACLVASTMPLDIDDPTPLQNVHNHSYSSNCIASNNGAALASPTPTRANHTPATNTPTQIHTSTAGAPTSTPSPPISTTTSSSSETILLTPENNVPTTPGTPPLTSTWHSTQATQLYAMATIRLPPSVVLSIGSDSKTTTDPNARVPLYKLSASSLQTLQASTATQLVISMDGEPPPSPTSRGSPTQCQLFRTVAAQQGRLIGGARLRVQDDSHAHSHPHPNFTPPTTASATL